MLRWIFACAAAMQPPAAGTDASAIELRYDAPASCPSEAQVRARIAALASTKPLPARVRIVAEGGGFRAHVEIEREGGLDPRELTAPSCAAVAEAAALVVAISPERAGEEPLPVDEPPLLTPEPPPSPDADDVDEPREPPSSREPSPPAEPVAPVRTTVPGLRIGVLADAGITWRTVHGVGPTIAGGLAIMAQGWRAELRVLGTTRTRTPLAEPADDVTAEVRSVVAQLRAAWVPRVRIVELPLHGGVELGAQWARPRGGTNREVGTAMLVALAAGAGIAVVPLPWLAFRAELAGLLALARPRFAVHTPTGDVVLETPRLGLRAVAGVELRIDPRAGRRRSPRR